MTRREFINRIAQFIGLLALPGAALAKTAQRTLIQQSPLAGFQHHEGQTYWPYLTVGDGLQLTREPHNPHDANAIRIDWLGHKLGYIPRAQNQTLARLIDQGRPLKARIGRLEKHPNPWRRMTVDVWMAG